ncbi:MAG: helix-turn-helix domain-containing protein, partial [Pseudomonadota bacterium]
MVTKTLDQRSKARGRPRQFDEDDVLDRAVDLLWRAGPTAVSLNELAAELGLAKPALARTFGSKDDLLAAVLCRYRDRVEAGLWEVLADAERPEEVARAYLRHFAEGLAA